MLGYIQFNLLITSFVFGHPYKLQILHVVFSSCYFQYNTHAIILLPHTRPHTRHPASMKGPICVGYVDNGK